MMMCWSFGMSFSWIKIYWRTWHRLLWEQPLIDRIDRTYSSFLRPHALDRPTPMMLFRFFLDLGLKLRKVIQRLLVPGIFSFHASQKPSSRLHHVLSDCNVDGRFILPQNLMSLPCVQNHRPEDWIFDAIAISYHRITTKENWHST
jgi:hypothetical protein